MTPKFSLTHPARTTSSIRVRATLQGERLAYRLDVRLAPDQWDHNRKRASRKAPDAGSVNCYLDSVTALLTSAYSDGRQTGKPLTVEAASALLDAYSGKATSTAETVCRWVPQYLDTAPYTGTTARGHRTSLGYLTQYAPGTQWEDLTSAWLDAFVSYLFKVRGLKPNTVGTVIKHVKTWAGAAHDRKAHSTTDYLKFKRPSVPTRSIALTKPQLAAIKAAQLPPALDRARDLFLVGVYTGQRVSDYPQFKPENRTDRRGAPGYLLTQVKTQKAIWVPEHAGLASLLDKYGGRLPKLSDQRLNDYLKRVGIEAGLTQDTEVVTFPGNVRTATLVPLSELVTTHTARRTFATLLAEAGEPLAEIGAILGHSSVRQTETYVKTSQPDKAARLASSTAFRNL